MTTDPAEAIVPTALKFIHGVTSYDAAAVKAVTADLSRNDLLALAIVLAAHVNRDRPVTSCLPLEASPEVMVEHAINLAAGMFNTTPEAIVARDKSRNVLDARCVAMAALRLMGLSSPYVGAAFDRDHSTVLHACGRVGESPRLHRLSLRIAAQLGWDRNDFEEAS